jgi:dTMP kinase
VKGYFISFEGSEGCGKSTQIQALAKILEAQGHSVCLTREPGGTALGESLRNLIQHDSAGVAMCPEAELLLFAASRAQLAREFIQPALDAGKIVLCDRYLDSTTVYQGVARALKSDAVATINSFATGTIRPDCTILLDLDPAVGLKRILARGEGQLDRMEQEPLEFFQAVRDGYLKLAQSERERISIFDAALPPEILTKAIEALVVERIA